MKLNQTDPNSYVEESAIPIEEALTVQRPLPPWRKKLLKDLEGNKNSTTFKIPGINAPVKPQDPKPAITPKKRNPKKLLKVVVVPLLLIHWFIVLIHNLTDVVCDSVREIILTLENFIRSDAQTEPNGPTPGE